MTTENTITPNINKNSIANKIFIKTSESVKLGILLAIVGGFLDAYTFICRGKVFANAQTGNIVLVGVELTRGDYKQAIMAFLQIFAFILGVIVSEKINSFSISSIALLKNVECIILIIEIIVLFIVGFIPTSVSPIFVTVPISFVSSVQISSFRTLIDSPYSTAMCTGNLRSACHAAYIAVTKKDKTNAAKATRYSVIILSFLIGAFICGISNLLFDYKSIWIASIILILCICLFYIDEYKSSKKNFN